MTSLLPLTAFAIPIELKAPTATRLTTTPERFTTLARTSPHPS
jgi:hypothetical protein